MSNEKSRVVIERRPERGFRDSNPNEDELGIGPDEVYREVREATDRAIELIETGRRSVSPDAVRLADDKN